MRWELVVRLLVAGVCGAIIGLERTSRNKEAGLRTHFLVAVGSALLMIVSKYAFQDVLGTAGVTLDPSRIAAQVVSGIGFLGAGTILVQRQSVKGLTTAAGLWSTSGIGLTIGAGMYGIGLCASVLVFIGLEILDRSLSVFLRKSSTILCEVRERPGIFLELHALLREFGVKVTRFEVNPLQKDQLATVECIINMNGPVEPAKLLEAMRTIQGISSVKIQ